ncbi:hypothetical protein JXM83_05450, partial [Candidatus Woesearchaeota archaeon]|nr:hypothetical protein [Candidatus Woesearchaeota archaeon]
ECLMGGGSLYGSFFENVLPVEGSSEKTCPISFYSSGNNITIPIVGLDGNLYIKDYDYEDKISVDNYRLKFSSEDIPDLIKGTYRLFTRDKTLLPKIMNGFLKL